jgi:D-3-phosphoglycerate dehydrogenase
MLALAKRIVASDRAARQQPGQWLPGAQGLHGTELWAKTLGLVGFGNAARAAARIGGDGLCMQVKAWARRPDAIAEAGVEYIASLDELLSSADFVSLHLALNPQTRGIIDARRIALLKPGAFFINTARGDLVDNEALIAALRSGRIAGAGLDVWPNDEQPRDDPLLALDNVILTQHIAGLTHESVERALSNFVLEIGRILSGERPALARLANPEVWDRRRPIRTARP